MNVLIVEDEKTASSRLKKLLEQIDQGIRIVGIEETIEDAINYLTNSPLPDLIFLDIQLSDGLSFEIFENINLKVPVIFTTAYDEYALKAFELNSIDYLLKPLDKKDIEKSLDKFRFLTGFKLPEYSKILPDLFKKKDQYKKRFIVKIGNSMEVLLTDDVALFYIENQIVHPFLFNNQIRSLDLSMDDLENCLQPNKFFRVNRQMIVNVKSIKKIHPFFNNRLLIELTIPFDKEIIVSRERVSLFKDWLES